MLAILGTRRAVRRVAFGKIAACGDFVRVGGPDADVERLDACVDAAIARAHTAGGAARPVGLSRTREVAFVEVGVTSAWRGLAGVIVPSVDAVGRAYPLVLAVTAPLGDRRRAIHSAPASLASFVDTALRAARVGATGPRVRLAELVAGLEAPDLDAPAVPPGARGASVVWTPDGRFVAVACGPLDPGVFAGAFGARPDGAAEGGP